jgi:hypothetical protein
VQQLTYMLTCFSIVFIHTPNINKIHLLESFEMFGSEKYAKFEALKLIDRYLLKIYSGISPIPFHISLFTYTLHIFCQRNLKFHCSLAVGNIMLKFEIMKYWLKSL